MPPKALAVAQAESEGGLNQQLQELNSTKDKLFSIIAHDLKSPFNGILGFSEVMYHNIQNNKHDKASEQIKIINSLAKSTLTLLDNLLAWARIQNGTLEYDPLKLKLKEVIDETIDILRLNAKMKNISVTSYVSNESLIHADQNMLQIILRNLISNAIKFTDKGGSIQLFVLESPEKVEITVKDNGIGINKKAIAKLFKIDTNTSKAGTENEKGSGIGLTLCKELVEKHRGSISVESKEGKGTEFRFTLPVFR